jgi:uncharacterized protein YacL
MAVQVNVTSPRRAWISLIAATAIAPISLLWVLICWNVMSLSAETVEELDRAYSAGNPEAWVLGAIGTVIGGGLCVAWVSRIRPSWRRFSSAFALVSLGTSLLFIGFWLAVFVGIGLGLVD